MRGHAWRVAVAVVLLTSVGCGTPAGLARGLSARPRCVFDHSTLRSSHGACRPHARRYPPAVHGPARRAIYDSSLLFGIPYPVLLNIGQCESGLNPNAASGGHYGLFPFLPQTFQGGARGIHRAVGIRVRTYWNAYDSAYVAGYLFAVGQSTQWSCETGA